MIKNRNLLTKTGLTTEYRSGDDGTYETGPSTPSSRFVDTGEGTVIDRHGGLLWAKAPQLIIPGPVGITPSNQIQSAEGVWSNLTDYIAADLVQGDGAPDALFYVCILANGPGGVGAQEPPNATYWRETIWTASAANLTTAADMDWDDSIDNCLALEYAGYGDWRLPNITEMLSLYNYEDSLSPSVFSPFDVESDIYWSSTTRKAGPTTALRMRFINSQSVVSDAKTDLNYVIPVRGGRING